MVLCLAILCLQRSGGSFLTIAFHLSKLADNMTSAMHSNPLLPSGYRALESHTLEMISVHGFTLVIGALGHSLQPTTALVSQIGIRTQHFRKKHVVRIILLRHSFRIEMEQYVCGMDQLISGSCACLVC